MFRNVLFALALFVMVTPSYAKAGTTSGAQSATATCNEGKALWSTYVSHSRWPGQHYNNGTVGFGVLWTDHNLPSWFPIRLRTDSWNSVVPDIFQRYPGEYMEVRMHGDPFHESCDAAGNLTVSFSTEFWWYAEKNGIRNELFHTALVGHLRPRRMPNGTIVADVLPPLVPRLTQNFISGFNVDLTTWYELYFLLNDPHWCAAFPVHGAYQRC